AGGLAGTCGTWSSWAGALRLILAGLGLRLRRPLARRRRLAARRLGRGRLLGVLVAGCRVRRIGDGSRRLIDLGLDRGLLPSFRGNALLVRAGLLDRLGGSLLARATWPPALAGAAARPALAYRA